MRNPRLKPLHLRWTLARMEARCARMARRAEAGPREVPASVQAIQQENKFSFIRLFARSN